MSAWFGLAFFSRRVFWLAVLGSSPSAGSALLVLWTFGGGLVGLGLWRLGLGCPALGGGGWSRLLSFELLPRVMPLLRVISYDALPFLFALIEFELA